MSLEVLLEAVCMTAPNAVTHYYPIHTASTNMFQQTADHDVGGRQPYCVKAIRDLCMCGCGLRVHIDVPSIFKQQKVFS